MNYSLGKTKNPEDDDRLVDKNLINHWKSLKKRPNIIGNAFSY